MARRTSDIAMLLGSSSKSRSSKNSGFTGKLVGFVDSLLGRKPKRNRRQERREQSVPMLVFAIAVLVAFGGGYAIGGGFGGKGKDSNTLIAPGRTPTFVDEVETQPLAAEAFIVSAYPGVPAADAKIRAHSLSQHLVGQGLLKARPYPWPQADGTLWVVAVYFDGQAEFAKTAQMLRDLPQDVPDEMFCNIRKNDRQSATGWPSSMEIPE